MYLSVLTKLKDAGTFSKLGVPTNHQKTYKVGVQNFHFLYEMLTN